MKLLVTRRMTERAEAALRARFDTTLLDRTQGLTPAEAAQAMRDYDAVMPTLGDRFSAEAFSQGLRCRLLANFGAGYNHIDVAAAARAMGDPVLLSAREDERLVEFLRGGFGDAIVSDGAPGRLVALALALAGPELADLPRIWALLSQHPAEIMRLPDRGRLDQGCRADLVVVARDSGAVEATISAGRLIHLTGQARDRFAAVLPRGRDDMGIAAE